MSAHRIYINFCFLKWRPPAEKKKSLYIPIICSKIRPGAHANQKVEQPSALPTLTCLFPCLCCVPLTMFVHVSISVNAAVEGKGTQVVTAIVHAVYLGIVIQNMVCILLEMKDICRRYVCEQFVLITSNTKWLRGMLK